MGASVLVGAAGLNRRRFLGLVGLGAGATLLPGCAGSGEGDGAAATSGRAPWERVVPTGRVREHTLRAAPMTVDLAGRPAATWGYGESLPGPEIRVTEGDTLRVTLDNGLPESTTVHWHGLPLINSMDGVPNLTQPPVAPGERFVYEFIVPEAGSFMYHSHVGVQLDRGLYGPLIVEPRREELAYDREYTLMLDDWLDGVAGTPEEIMAAIDARDDGGGGGNEGGGNEGGGNEDGGNGGGGGDDEGDTTVSFGGTPYPLFLINGRPPEDPVTLDVARGDRIRLRVMNIGASTGLRFAVAGHRLTVTHTDGMTVEPVTVQSLRIGMGERFDVLVEADNPGVWQIAATPEDRPALARAVLRYTDSTVSAAPPPDTRPAELTGRLPAYEELRAAAEILPPSEPDRVHELTLGGHTINDQTYPDAEPLDVVAGERVRVTMHNVNRRWHPMHLHGHHFQVATPSGRGPIKDTVSVPGGGGRVSFDVLADNPGRWLFHCHNLYHMEQGMARALVYR